ncbi:MAG: histidine phosphatase family protein [Nocardioidaceae bacterium]|nr:histidine phosphatase family protein [Nocardioidaceae bacterium]
MTRAPEPETTAEEVESPASARESLPTPTTIILVRHGVTAHTTGRRFSGGLGGDNPSLSQEGRDQIEEVAGWLTQISGEIDSVLFSPVARTAESAQIIATALDLPLLEEPRFAEMEFGEWDGLSFAEVTERDKERLDAWFADMEAAPPGGESFVAVRRRVLAGLDDLVAAHAGRTVVVLSHVTPIKTMVAHTVGAPLEALFKLELAPAAVSVLTFYPDHRTGEPRGSLRFFNSLAPGRRTLRDLGHW